MKNIVKKINPVKYFRDKARAEERKQYRNVLRDYNAEEIRLIGKGRKTTMIKEGIKDLDFKVKPMNNSNPLTYKKGESLTDNILYWKAIGSIAPDYLVEFGEYTSPEGNKFYAGIPVKKLE